MLFLMNVHCHLALLVLSAVLEVPEQVPRDSTDTNVDSGEKWGQSLSLLVMLPMLLIISRMQISVLTICSPGVHLGIYCHIIGQMLLVHYTN